MRYLHLPQYEKEQKVQTPLQTKSSLSVGGTQVQNENDTISSNSPYFHYLATPMNPTDYYKWMANSFFPLQPEMP